MTTLLVTILVYVLVTVALLFVLALVAASLAILRTELKYGHIPGPKRDSFFLGSYKQLTEGKIKIGPASHVLLLKWTRDFGPVFWFRMLWIPHVFAFTPEIVKELLLSSQHKKPLSIYTVFQEIFGRRFMGRGLVSEIDHEKWFHKRSLVNPGFRRKYLIGMMEHFNDSADKLCQQLFKKADGQTEVLMAEEFYDVTLDVIAKVAFGMNADELRSGKPSAFRRASVTAFKGLERAMTDPFASRLDPRSEPRKFREDVREAIGLLRDEGRRCITERIAARQRGDHVPSDILNVILDNANDLKNNDDDFGMENLLDEFVTLFVAGQDTTSNLLTSTIHQLGRNPGVFPKLQAEVDEVLGQKPTIEYEDLAKLENMMKVFKETLRLYSPAGGTTRVSAYPIKHGHITIPAGTNISVMSNVMGRMEDYFDDPLLFNPDRFEAPEDGTIPRHLYAYFPFSLGQRSCIGQQFALMEARVILGKLLQRFEFRLDQGQRTTYIEEITLKPIDKCRNYITLRA